MLQKVILSSIERNVSHGVGEDLLCPVNPRTEMSSKWVKSLMLQLVFGQQLKGNTSYSTKVLRVYPCLVLWQATTTDRSSSFDAFWFTLMGHSIPQGFCGKKSVCASPFCGFKHGLFFIKHSLFFWRTSALSVVQELYVVLNLERPCLHPCSIFSISFPT